METAYLSHEMSAGCKETLTGLTPVETVDQVDSGAKSASEIPSKEHGNRSVKRIESDAVVESLSMSGGSAKEKKGKTTKPKFPFRVEETEAAVQKTKESVTRLHSYQDYTSVKCTEDLDWLHQIAMLPIKYRNMKLLCFDVMADNRVTSIFKEVMDQNLTLPFEQPSYKTSYVNMRAIIVAHWNGSDTSQKLCDNIIEQGMYRDILGYLQGEVLKLQDLESPNKIYCVKGLLGILHNLCQRCTNARALLRDNNAVEIVQAYRNSTNNMIRCKALMVLVHIIDEKENDMINSDDQPIQFMLTILKDALDNQEHISMKYCYRAIEIMEVLNRLAGSDSNKIKMVKHGALEYYAKLLEDSNSKEEQALSAKGLWALAFKTKNAILSDEKCMQGLKHLVEHSTEKEVLSQVKGALWILKGQEKEEFEKKKNGRLSFTRPTEDLESSDASHIMISYQWGSKSTVLEIKDQLKEAGYKVWMDEDDMEGNILDGMADAIEKARIVLVCMSEKYKDSPNCRTEAEYAFKLRKKIVPLKLQYKYDPDGWLGIIVGTKLYFDFSEDYRYEKSLKGLLKELGGKLQNEQPVTPAYAPETMTSAPRPHVTGIRELEKWDQNKVQSWLDKNKLAKYKDKFSEFDGVILLEYKLMMENAPDFFFTSLRDTIKLPLVDILRFSSSLRNM